MKPSIKNAEQTQLMTFKALGAGNEVGRSCFILEYKNRRIMLDCGAHPAWEGRDSLPLFEYVDDMSSIDMLLVSHFHIDHVGSLPHLLESTEYCGPVFMTHPTKAISKMILTDSIKVSHVSSTSKNNFTEADLRRAMEKVTTINYHQEVSYKGVKFWCYNAGHVLGAAMFMIEIGGIKVLYTGDYSRQEDRHLKVAELPQLRPDVLIVESTYGIQEQEPRRDREKRLLKYITNTVIRGGKVLLPLFALGRSQELMLIIDEYWKEHPELQKYPVYFATYLGKKCLIVYQTFVDMMVDRIQRKVAAENPFMFKFIRDLQNADELNSRQPCVIMASPGMLQSGISRDLFERWCNDEKNAVILAGYTVEGTFAHEILKEPPDICLRNGKTIPLKMAVHSVSFSAHVDYSQNVEFIDSLKPPHIILVHGARAEMKKLHSKLEEKYKSQNIKIHTPENGQLLSLSFITDRNCRMLGRIANKYGAIEQDNESHSGIKNDPIVDSKAEIKKENGLMDLEPKIMNNLESQDEKSNLQQNNDKPNTMTNTCNFSEDSKKVLNGDQLSNSVPLSGILFMKNFEQTLVDIEDLHAFSNLTTSTIYQQMKIPLIDLSFEQVYLHLSYLYDSVEGPINHEGFQAYVCASTVFILNSGENEITLKWNSTPNDDILADSIIALLAHIQTYPNSFIDTNKSTRPQINEKNYIKCENNIKSESEEQKKHIIQNDEAQNIELEEIGRFLKVQFSDIEIDSKLNEIKVKLDNKEAIFDYKNRSIKSNDEALQFRLNDILVNIYSVLFPIERHEPSFVDRDL